MRVAEDALLLILSCLEFDNIDEYAEILRLSPNLTERIKKHVYKKRLRVIDTQDFIEFYVDGILHREDGPARISKDGLRGYWHQNNKFHRLDGPAAINTYRYLEGWYVNDKLHRIGGPALVHSTAAQEWYQNGVRHRDDGPAIIQPNGRSEYYINGVKSKRPKSYKIVPRQKLVENCKAYYAARLAELVPIKF